MSDGVIKSGRNGNTAEVDDDGRLMTFSVTQTQAVTSTREGQAFFLSHGIVNLTTDTESVIFYVRNDDIVPWVLSDIKTIIGKSTGGTGDLISRVISNPSGGTVIENNTNVGAAANLNDGSANSLPSTIRFGFEGATATGGASLFPGILVGDQREIDFISAPIIIQPSRSFAYAVTPSAGNTSVNLKLNVTVFRDTEDM